MDKVDTGQKHNNGKPIMERRQVRYNGFFTADEGEAFNQLKSRNGSTLGATVRSMWYGATAGNANADPDKRRILNEGSYSLGMAIGWQPDTIEPLLNDAATGTPQRFIYCWADDPNIPDERQTPEPIISRELKTDVGLISMDADIKDEWWRWQRSKSKGAISVPRLDSHAYLTIGKIAANLTLVHQQHHVSAEYWALAEQVWRVSCRVRNWLVMAAAARQGQIANARDERIINRGTRLEAERLQVVPKVERIARSLAGHVHTDGDRTTASAVRRLDSKDRDYAGPAWEHAAAVGWVVLGDPLPRGKDNRAVKPGRSQPTDGAAS